MTERAPPTACLHDDLGTRAYSAAPILLGCLSIGCPSIHRCRSPNDTQPDRMLGGALLWLTLVAMELPKGLRVSKQAFIAGSRKRLHAPVHSVMEV